MPDSLYELQNATKTFGERCVLNIGSMKIERGEILAIVGPSGAGKSTLLRMLNFLDKPTSGRIRFQDQWFDANEEPTIDVRRRITTVFQRPILLKRSVRENVRYGLGLRGMRNSHGPVEEVLSEVGLGGLMEQSATSLSGGEAQRVALARAMILRPDVLLMDEPTANLDPQNVALIEQIVRRLNDEEATTIVLVTHNIFQAKRLAKRVAFFLEGELVELATTERIFQSPQDPRTESFVGGEMIY